MSKKFTPIVMLAGLVLAGCKVPINVPPEGRVVTDSGTFSCEAGQTCVVEFTDMSYDETFRAEPKPNYVFSHWAYQDEGGVLCAGNSKPCRLVPGMLADDPAIQELVEGDNSYPMNPVFIPAPCDLAGVNTSSTTDFMLNNGKTAASSSNQFHNPAVPLDVLAVRNSGCGQGGDPFSSCGSPGNATGALLSACQVMHRLVVSENSRAELDRAVVLEMLYILGRGEVTIASADVAHVELHDSAKLTVQQGWLDGIHPLGNSLALVTGGEVRQLDAIDNAVARVQGGRVNQLTAFDTGTIYVEDGDLRILDSNKNNPYAGYISAQGMGRLVWTGGRTTKGEIGNKTDGNLVLSFDSAKITIVGTEFKWSNAAGTIVDQPLPYGKLPAVLGWLSGKLENGDKFKQLFFEQRTGSQIVLEAP